MGTFLGSPFIKMPRFNNVDNIELAIWLVENYNIRILIEPLNIPTFNQALNVIIMWTKLYTLTHCTRRYVTWSREIESSWFVDKLASKQIKQYAWNVFISHINIKSQHLSLCCKNDGCKEKINDDRCPIVNVLLVTNDVI